MKDEEFEDSGRFHPRVYGPIDLKALGQVVDFLPEEDGTFRPPELSS